MPEVDEIIERIVEVLNLNLQIFPDEQTERTRFVLRHLLEIGNGFYCRVWTTGHPEGAAGGEWLYDQTWTYCEEEDWDNNIWSIPMVAECEWNRTLNQVRGDFEKLMQARAQLRVMIVDAGAYQHPIEQQLCEWVSLLSETEENDTYLIVVYKQRREAWEISFFRMHSNGCGVPAELNEIIP